MLHRYTIMVNRIDTKFGTKMTTLVYMYSCVPFILEKILNGIIFAVLKNREGVSVNNSKKPLMHQNHLIRKVLRSNTSSTLLNVFYI